MRYELSIHCLEQLEARSIAKEIVHLVLNEPDQILEEEESQKIYQKVVEGYLYRVFLNFDKNPTLVKTVYRTSKINKYL